MSESAALRVTGVDLEMKTVTVEPTYDTVHPDYYVVTVRKPGTDYSQSFWIHYERGSLIEGWRIGGYIHVDSRHWSLDDLIAGKSGLKS